VKSALHFLHSKLCHQYW